MFKFYLIFIPFFVGIVFGLPMKDHDFENSLLQNKLRQLNLFEGNAKRKMLSDRNGNQGKGALLFVKYPLPYYLSDFDHKGNDAIDGLSNNSKDFYENQNKDLIYNSNDLKKRNFDEIDRAGFTNFKRNLDEIGHNGLDKINQKFDDANRMILSNFKRNFDEIDRAGFTNFKRNIDEKYDSGCHTNRL